MILLGVQTSTGPGSGGDDDDDDNNNNNRTRRAVPNLFKRQTSGGFVGGGDAATNPTSCSQANLFLVFDGQLVDGSGAVRVDPGVPYIEFATQPTGSISTTFSLVDGRVRWFNETFFGGEAGFCRVPGGQVYITFSAPEFWPAGCRLASVTSFQGKPEILLPKMPD